MATAASKSRRPGPAAGESDPVLSSWRPSLHEILGVGDVRPDDNFFDLGGSSLIAIEVQVEIEQRLGVALPVHALLEAPTPNGLADEIRGLLPAPGAAPPASHSSGPRLLVRLSPATQPAAPALFLAQPIGGTVFSYFPLARRLDWPGVCTGWGPRGLQPLHDQRG